MESELLSKFEYAHIQLLPEFDGSSSCSLDYFIARCDSFLTNFTRIATAPQASLINEFLFNVVKSKLKGEARSILDVEANCSYVTFKEKLIRKYGDVKNEHILLKEISNCFQTRRETYMQYHERLDSLTQRYKNLCKINYSEPILALKLSEIETLSLNTFKAGILEPHRSYLRYAQITDFSQALRICRSYDNDRAYESYMDQLRDSDGQNLSKFNKPYLPPINRFPSPHLNRTYPNQKPVNIPRPTTQLNPASTSAQNLPNYPPRLPTPNEVRPNLQPVPKPNHSAQNSFRRPYPTPNNIGRRFGPQNHSSFPKPMSGISTIRGNMNAHEIVEDDPADFYYNEDFHNYPRELENEIESDPAYFSSEEVAREYDEFNQDFRTARPLPPES